MSISRKKNDLSHVEHEYLLRGFQHITRLALSSLDLETILNNLAEEIIRVGIFRSLMIALVNEKDQTIEIVRNLINENMSADEENPSVKVKYHKEMIGTRYALEEDNVTPTTARTGVLQIIESLKDQRLDSRFDSTEKFWNEKVAYFIPVKLGNRTIAVLGTGSFQRQKPEMLR